MLNLVINVIDYHLILTKQFTFPWQYAILTNKQKIFQHYQKTNESEGLAK